MTGKNLWQKIVDMELQEIPQSKKIYKLIKNYQNIDIPTENLEIIDQYLSQITKKIDSNSDDIGLKSKEEKSLTPNSSNLQNRIEQIERKLDLILEALEVENKQQRSSTKDIISQAVAPKPKKNQVDIKTPQNTRNQDETTKPDPLERLRKKLKTHKASQ